MDRRFLPLIALALTGTPALAAERIATITSYDRIRVDGPYRVEIITGRGASAKIVGDRAAIDRVELAVQGTTLTIRANSSAWQGGWPGENAGGPVVIRLTAGELRTASIAGSGSIAIDAIRGPRIMLIVEGSGRIGVGAVEADRLEVVVTGSGAMMLAGHAKAMSAAVRGASSLDAAGLVAGDLVLVSESAGNVALAARTSAKVTATGSGDVAIGGAPACTVTARGSGAVRCGAGR